MPSVLSQPEQDRANPRVYDGFLAISRGVQSGRAKNLLTPNHAAFAINTTFRDDHPRPRPGWFKRELTYDDNRITAEGELALTIGKWQGAAVFQSLNGSAHLVVAKGGRLFKIDVLSPGNLVKDVTPLDSTGAFDLNNPILEQSWFAHPPGFLVIQNGLQLPIIYDGTTSRRSSPAARQVPMGTVMAYGQGRLWVASIDRCKFIASDLIYDPNVGNPSIQFRDSCLYFTENELIDDGGSFGVPVNAGRITAMKFTGNMDTSTGQGPLQIFTEDSVFTVDAPYDRELWAVMSNPIQTVSLPAGGTTGQFAVTAVNGDLWYRDRLGVRSFQVARREFGTWSNTPLSRAVEAVLKHDDVKNLKYASAVQFDNRLLMTVCPQQGYDLTNLWGLDVGIYHLGLVALDFAHVSDSDDLGISQQVPVWEGLWTGLKILQIVSGVFDGEERCFLFVLSAFKTLELWELSKDEWYDSINNPIEWKIYTPSYSFGDPAMLKMLKKGELWLDNLQGEPDIALAYQPDDYPAYTDWYNWSLCATTEDCFTAQCVEDTWTLKSPQVRASLNIPEPETACRVGQRNLTMNKANTFSIKFTNAGAFSISKLRLCAIPQTDALIGECQGEVCETLPNCTENWWSYTTAYTSYA